jgi:phage recombination protein Bet
MVHKEKPTMQATMMRPTRAKKLTYTLEELRLMRETIIPKDVPEPEFKLLVHLSEVTGANIFLGQMHLVPRWNSRMGRNVYTPQLSVHGLSLLATQSKDFAGSDPCHYAYKQDGTLESASVTVYKLVQGVRCSFTGAAFFEEYVQRNNKGEVTGLWREKPRRMIEKCAYSNAVRQAWQEQTGGLYSDEEMPLASLSEPETDPERERLVNGIKRLCKEYALPLPEEDLYAVSHERLWEKGARVTRISERQRTGRSGSPSCSKGSPRRGARASTTGTGHCWRAARKPSN